MLWITACTNWTLPAIDNKEAFQADSFCLILSAIGWRWRVLGLPLKIGTPRYWKGIEPNLKFRTWKIKASLPGVMEPENMVDLEELTTCLDSNAFWSKSFYSALMPERLPL
jgi:hypothetical protein